MRANAVDIAVANDFEKLGALCGVGSIAEGGVDRGFSMSVELAETYSPRLQIVLAGKMAV